MHYTTTTRPTGMLVWACFLGASLSAGMLAGKDSNELAKRATWSQPADSQIRDQLVEYLTRASASPEQTSQALGVFDKGLASADRDPLSVVVASVGVVQPIAKQLQVLSHVDQPPTSPPTAAVNDSSLDPWLQRNLRLYLGRWLVQHELYDEANDLLKDLEVSEVLDPAALLFHQAVCAHQLLDKERFEKHVRKLLENESLLPRRYRLIAELMDSDLSPVEKDSLDEIQRLMGDVRRRLNLGRAGKRVRDEEDEVIAKLDKLIKKAEDQQKQQQAAGAAGAGSQTPSAPAQDSQAAPGGGQGIVDAKKLSHKAGWGNLPPKERQDTLQQISKDLPAHYREVIEEYFRKLARDEEK